jgi:hypothetical protein
MAQLTELTTRHSSQADRNDSFGDRVKYLTTMPSSNNNNKDLQLQGSSSSAVKQFPELTLFCLF